MPRSAWSAGRILGHALGFGSLIAALAIGLHGTGRAGCTTQIALASEPSELEPPGRPEAVVLAAAFRPLALIPARGPLEVQHTAAGSFLGVRDDLLLGPILRGHPVEVKVNRGGSSISLRVDLDDGARAAFKPDQSNLQTIPRYEIAAYRLNRLLGLDRVAPAVPKAISFAEILDDLTPGSRALTPRLEAEITRQPDGMVWGEASYWIPVIRDLHIDSPEAIAEWSRWLTVGETIPRGEEMEAEQISTMIAFDFLTNNSDRWSGGNEQGDANGRHLYYMDNTLAFAYGMDVTCKRYLALSEKYSRSFYLSVKALDESRLRAALAAPPQGPWPILDDHEIAGLMARRDYLVAYIDGLIDVFGAREVLAFP